MPPPFIFCVAWVTHRSSNKSWILCCLIIIQKGAPYKKFKLNRKYIRGVHLRKTGTHTHIHASLSNLTRLRTTGYVSLRKCLRLLQFLWHLIKHSKCNLWFKHVDLHAAISTIEDSPIFMDYLWFLMRCISHHTLQNSTIIYFFNGTTLKAQQTMVVINGLL